MVLQTLVDAVLSIHFKDCTFQIIVIIAASTIHIPSSLNIMTFIVSLLQLPANIDFFPSIKYINRSEREEAVW